MIAVAARWLATVLLTLSLCVTASTQTPSQIIPPLPAAERIVPASPISVTLRLGPNRIAIREVPTFTVVIRNNGDKPLVLNPAAVSHIRIFTQSGEIVPPAITATIDYAYQPLKRSEFIPLGPGQTHEFAVQPWLDLSSTYLDSFSGSERRLQLPAGNYSVWLTYVAFPDASPRYYDAYEVADVWEGSIEAPSVPLTVLGPSEDDVRDAIARIDSDDPAIGPSLDVLRLGRVERAIEPLLQRFNRTLDMRVAEASLDIDAGRAAPRLLAMFGAVQGHKGDQLRTTFTFEKAARAAQNCSPVPLILEATGYGAETIVTALGDSLRGLGDRCPDLRSQLIALLRTPVPVPTVYRGGEAAYARGRAARALGYIGNPEDVALLIAVLRRDIPGLPPATNWYGDPVREGAARALGRLGGPQAADALFEQLNDQVTNRRIMLVVVEELGRLNPPGTAEALARLLTSSNDEPLLVRVLITLQQLRATTTVPQLVVAMSHSKSTVRSYASAALLSLGEASAASAMRSAAESADQSVRANGLFYLARHGNAAALPLFLQGITSNVQSEREASVEGIARFGTRETFVPLRSALERPGGVASYIGLALSRLTFAPIRETTSLTEWDEWWKTHGQRTRLQWAQEALDAPWVDRNASPGPFARPELFAAARYLANIQSPPRPLIERSLNHPSWSVRDSLIAAVERYDRPRAAALLLRELDGRYLAACRNAVQRLNTLSGEKQAIDCTRQADRARAREHWASLVSREVR